MDIFGSIALAIFCITIGWFIGYHLQVVPLRIENHALLTLLDEHLNKQAGLDAFEAEIQRQLDEGKTYRDLTLVDDGYAWPNGWTPSVSPIEPRSQFDKDVEQALGIANVPRGRR